MQFPYFGKCVFALQSVWVKTGMLQWWRNWKPHKWMDVRVALEQFTGSDGMRDSILFIYYMYHEEKKVRSAGDPQKNYAWQRKILWRKISVFKEGKLWYVVVLGINLKVSQGNSEPQAFLS